MSSLRYGVLATGIGLALLLTSAVAQQPVPPPKPATSTPPATPATPPPPPPKADPLATKSLEQAIEMVDPNKRLGWVETKLWQQVDLHGLTFQAEGRYLAGPKNRVRLDLKVHLGGTEGETNMVCDGTTVWQTIRTGSGERAVSRWELTKVLDALKAPGMQPQLSEEFLRSQLLRGLAPLLHSLQEQIVFTQQASERWNSREVLKLSGVWSAEITKAISPRGDGWPPFLPRTCHVYLDSKTLWPARLEWWGPASAGPADALLFQMEFRDPVLHKAEDPMPQGFADAFKFDAGSAQVPDETAKIIERLKVRNQQLAAQKKTTSPPGPGK